MKKTLVALAALAATASFAQNAITIYGNLDQGIYRQTDNGNSYSKIASNVNSTSVLGFRGVEDLGGGNTAGFHLLSELSLPEGQVGSSTSGDAAPYGGQKSNFFTRAANIYFTNKDIGSFEIGRIQDAVWLTQGAFSNTASNSFGWSTYTATQTNFGDLVSRNMGSKPADQTYWGTTTGQSGCGVTAAKPTDTAANCFGTQNNAQSGSAQVAFNAGWGFKTANISGFQLTYQHVGNNFQQANGSASIAASQGSALRLEYTNGPLNLQYAQTQRQDASDYQGAKWKVMGATYQMGAAKLVAAQSKLTTGNGFASIDGNTVTGLGVIYDISPMVDVAAGYTTLKDDKTSQQASVIGFTGRYKFTKRTQVYAGYGKENQDSALKVTMFYGGPSGTSTAGASSTGYLVGIRHSF